MVATIIHRGPNGENTWLGDDVDLDMRRLAIVDVQSGRQPLANEDNSVRVVFNKEIYNHHHLREALVARGHRLENATDGEVIAHLWEEHGADCVARLDGIFAFALWDAKRRALLL